MESEPLVSREEARAMLLAIADINLHVDEILRLLEEKLEEGPEADT